jgi:hypothetical protein
MEIYARKVLDKNSEAAQLDLELRIAGLEATAEFLRQRVAARESQAAPVIGEAANLEPVKPAKIVAGVRLNDKTSEVAQDDPPARTESKEAKAASLPGRPAVEEILAAKRPGSWLTKRNVFRVPRTTAKAKEMAARRRLNRNHEVIPFHPELQTSRLNTIVHFSRNKLGLHMFHRQRGKINRPTKLQAFLIQTCNSFFADKRQNNVPVFT